MWATGTLPGSKLFKTLKSFQFCLVLPSWGHACWVRSASLKVENFEICRVRAVGRHQQCLELQPRRMDEGWAGKSPQSSVPCGRGPWALCRQASWEASVLTHRRRVRTRTVNTLWDLENASPPPPAIYHSLCLLTGWEEAPKAYNTQLVWGDASWYWASLPRNPRTGCGGEDKLPRGRSRESSVGIRLLWPQQLRPSSWEQVHLSTTSHRTPSIHTLAHPQCGHSFWDEGGSSGLNMPVLWGHVRTKMASLHSLELLT
jgi:hypothetical protein